MPSLRENISNDDLNRKSQYETDVRMTVDPSLSILSARLKEREAESLPSSLSVHNTREKLGSDARAHERTSYTCGLLLSFPHPLEEK